MRGLCNLRPARQLRTETGEIASFPSFLLLASHAVAVQRVLSSPDVLPAVVLGINSVPCGHVQGQEFAKRWTALKFTERGRTSSDHLPGSERLCAMTPHFLERFWGGQGLGNPLPTCFLSALRAAGRL